MKVFNLQVLNFDHSNTVINFFVIYDNMQLLLASNGHGIKLHELHNTYIDYAHMVVMKYTRSTNPLNNSKGTTQGLLAHTRQLLFLAWLTIQVL